MQSEKLASMGQLAAGIAHEVNNPLGRGADVRPPAAGRMRREVEDARGPDDDRRAGRPLQEDRRRAAQFRPAEQGRAPSGRHAANWSTGRCATIPLPENIALQIEHDLDDPMAEVDRDQIVQVLTNLVTNAVAAMESGGTLTVRTTRRRRTTCGSASSTPASGIPPENMKKIFEPFFTTKQMGKGTGLGLAVTYGIVKMHSGDIRVAVATPIPANGPTGTTFTVTLPQRSE